MAGMKVTLSAAMRARDVSRPTADDEEAARKADRAGSSGPGPSGPGASEPGATGSARSRNAGRADGADRSGRPESPAGGRTESSDRSGTARNSSGRRRKRR
jgi:hypothetical protein